MWILSQVKEDRDFRYRPTFLKENHAVPVQAADFLMSVIIAIFLTENGDFYHTKKLLTGSFLF